LALGFGVSNESFIMIFHDLNDSQVRVQGLGFWGLGLGHVELLQDRPKICSWVPVQG